MDTILKFLEPGILMLTSAALSLMGALYAALRANQQRKLVQKRRATYAQALRTAKNKMVHDLEINVEDEVVWGLTQETSVYDGPTGAYFVAELVPGALEKEVEQRITALRERLEKVEERFPEEATLEKIASLNDAIMATKIEELEKSLKRVEDKLLTKWDVAMIVFTVVGALGGLVGLTLGVITFAMKGSGG